MFIDIDENKIRKYLIENITEYDKGASIHLFDLDFNNDSIEVIIEHINSLYDDVISLNSMVKRNFQSENGEKVLMPQSREIQQGIVQDLSVKNTVLQKVLESPDIFSFLVKYRKSLNNNELKGRQ